MGMHTPRGICSRFSVVGDCLRSPPPRRARPWALLPPAELFLQPPAVMGKGTTAGALPQAPLAPQMAVNDMAEG